MLWRGRIAAMRSRRNPHAASPPAPRSARWAIFGKLAYGEGATVGTLLARPLRARRRAVLGARRGAGAGARLRALAPPRPRRRPRARRVRLRAPGRRATSPRCERHRRVAARRCCSTRSPRSSPSPRSRSAASGSTRRRRGRARARLGGLVLVARRRRRGRARSRSAPRSASAPRVVYSAYILAQRGIAGARRAAAARALVCTGAAMTLTVGRRRSATCARAR